MTCSAYERDVGACLASWSGRGSRLGEVQVARTCAASSPSESSAGRPPRARRARSRAQVLLPLPGRERAARPRPGARRCARRRSARRCPTCSTGASSRGCSPATERDDVWKRHFAGKRERDRLLLALFAYAGLRRSELLGLDWDDVDLERRLLRVRKAKGGRQRTSRSTPRSSRSSSTTSAVRAAIPSRRSSSASRAGGSRRRS